MNEFVICIDSGKNPGSLVVGKAYRVLVDAKAQTHGLLRIVDEDRSEPDGYLYSASLFVPIELSDIGKRALTAAGI